MRAWEVSRTVSAEADPDWGTLRRVAAGDVEAFAPLVERHQERLLRVCARLLHDADEARDAAQEVLLRAFRGAAAVRPVGQVFTWLYRIAVNHCLNRLRRRSLVRFLSLSRGDDDDEPPYDPADQSAGPDRALDAGRRWRAVRREIERLPPNQRAVLVLAKFEGLSYREIAGILGTTESAVESRLVRAMKALTRAQEMPGSPVSRGGER